MPKTKTTKKRSRKQRRKFYTLGIEFIKLQLAGNIPFWGTYLLFFVFDKGFAADTFSSLLAATVIANALFFIVDDKWVFNNSRGKRKTTNEILKFVVFMSFSSLLTFNITWQLDTLFGITPYIGQFISAALSTLWTFIGLRFWVFAPPRHHGLIAPKTPTKI